MKPKLIGFVVIECCEDYEQILAVEHGPGLPKEGLLTWAGIHRRTVFPTRAEARAAIDRTEHYRLAFGLVESYPYKSLCRIDSVVTYADQPRPISMSHEE